MSESHDSYFNGYREGSREKKEQLAQILERWKVPNEWTAQEVKRAAIAIIRNERLP